MLSTAKEMASPSMVFSTLLSELVAINRKRTYRMFSDREGNPPPEFEPAQKIKIASKILSEYSSVLEPPRTNGENQDEMKYDKNDSGPTGIISEVSSDVTKIIYRIQDEKDQRDSDSVSKSSKSSSLVLFSPSTSKVGGDTSDIKDGSLVMSQRPGPHVPTPTWHAPWKLQSVISGHLGWVRAIAFDPGNEWFVTGSADRTIKVWDLAKCSAGSEGGLKLTLTGHINCIRGLAISPRHPYMFSAGEDKKVLCWDLECNKVIRHYHGHLSGIFALSLHPTLDILVTAGRDSVARVWDIRSKQQIYCLAGHTNAVGSLLTNSIDPQIITGSHDRTIKLWDLVAGKSFSTLTHHKKAVRALALGRREFSFVSAAADNMKRWQARDGMFLNNMRGHNSIINALSINDDNVLFSGGDNGSITMWDYATGYPFQQMRSGVQPGSLEAEAGIFCSSFDMSGCRLVTGEADKSIKIWKEDPDATPETHPIDLKQWTKDYMARRR